MNYLDIQRALESNEPKIRLETLKDSDEAEFLSLAKESKSIHHPWVSSPDTPEKFKTLLDRNAEDNFVTLLVKPTGTDKIAGVFNLSQIFRGDFQNTILGCYVNHEFQKKRYMRAGLLQAVAYAFFKLELHRVEANVQPDNISSVKLFENAGFRDEGYSKNYLRIDGKWRDHRKFAVTLEDWGMLFDKNHG